MLPPHLQKYRGLIDLLVEHLVREIEEEEAAHKPPSPGPPVEPERETREAQNPPGEHS